MKRTAALALCLALSVPACATWWQQLRANPVARLQNDVGYIRTAVSLARAAFDIWANLFPSGSDAVRVSFNTIVGNVERGVATAQSALQVASHAGASEPDSDALLRDARSAVGSLNAFLSGLPGNGPGRASDPTMREALAATEAASRPSAY